LFQGERECADTAVQPQPNVQVFDEMKMMRGVCGLVTARSLLRAQRDRHARRSSRNSVDFESDCHRVDVDGKFCGEISTCNFIQIVLLRSLPKIADNFILLSTSLFTFSIRARSVRAHSRVRRKCR
jgi:hypothetical protein